MKVSLVIMAAGLGSRYGGSKQVDGVGPNGEILMEYSIYDALRAGFINGLEERIELSNDDYTVSNISLQFHQYSDKIEYVVTCDATFRIRMFGELFPPITQHITLTGSHNTKY